MHMSKQALSSRSSSMPVSVGWSYFEPEIVIIKSNNQNKNQLQTNYLRTKIKREKWNLIIT